MDSSGCPRRQALRRIGTLTALEDRLDPRSPHPVADQRTEQLAVGVLRDAPGGVLVIAGARRKAGDGDSADVAHRRDTVFHAVCAELARRGTPGVQLHGFAASSAPDYDSLAATSAGEEGRIADARHVPFPHVEFAPAAHDIGTVVSRWENAPPRVPAHRRS
ncbi:hypothetical protein [Streptomyces bauhiniae]|uniref:hypothetical protein n=1 Tax=Streptomyces bauhiniae TaxID=2340725 RepID=UPI003454215A